MRKRQMLDVHWYPSNLYLHVMLMLSCTFMQMAIRFASIDRTGEFHHGASCVCFITRHQRNLQKKKLNYIYWRLVSTFDFHIREILAGWRWTTERVNLWQSLGESVWKLAQSFSWQIVLPSIRWLIKNGVYGWEKLGHPYYEMANTDALLGRVMVRLSSPLAAGRPSWFPQGRYDIHYAKELNQLMYQSAL